MALSLPVARGIAPIYRQSAQNACTGAKTTRAVPPLKPAAALSNFHANRHPPHLLLVAAVSVVSPGPATMLAIRNGGGGVRAVLPSTLGNVTGCSRRRHAGLGVVLQSSALLFTLVKVAGAAYLLTSACAICLAARISHRRPNRPRNSRAAPAVCTLKRRWWRR